MRGTTASGRGARLPAESEWEKAARGTDGREYPWGDGWDADKANTSEHGPGTTTAVGSYPAGVSPYGALDTAGNVWEWVADWYDAVYYERSPGHNPTGPSSGEFKVLRGGSWTYPYFLARSAARIRLIPDIRFDFYGFRCARSS